MVNFTEKLDANVRAEWASHYIDYRALKKAMKKASSQPGSTDVKRARANSSGLREPLLPGAQGAAAEQGTPLAANIFLAALHAERDKVQGFYEAELQRLTEQEHVLQAQMGRASELSSAERSSVTLAAIDLFRMLQYLRNFCILNYTGLLKAVKKFDKKAGVELMSDSKAEFDRLSFVQNTEVDDVSNRLESAFAWAFCDGSLQVAHSTLLVRKERPASWPLLSLGLRLGFALSLAMWIAWDTTVDPQVMDLPTNLGRQWRWLYTQLPVYRCCFAAVLCAYLWAACLHIWGKARINYRFMFDLESKHCLTAIDAASLGTRLAIVCMLSLLLLTKALLGELPDDQVCPGLFPAAMFLLVLASLVLPQRRGKLLFTSLGRVLTAPLRPVTFWDSFVADVLTSLVKPMIDFAYSLCYVATLEWRERYAHQGACISSRLLLDVINPAICAVPLWCRFMQCLRVYHDTNKRVPALPNALKYAVSLLVVLFGVLHQSVVTSFSAETEWIQAAWLLCYLGTTLYTFFWDVHMDWRLHQLHRCGLRERLMFRRRALYYVAVAIDLLLRFGWTMTVIPHNEFLSDFAWFSFQARWVIPLVSAAELCRRAMWAVLRLESEHLHNTEGFRRVDVIPLHFDHTANAAGAEPPAERRSHVLLELFAYAAVVVLLAVMSYTTRSGWVKPPKGSPT